MGVRIESINYYLPKKIITNSELEKEFPEWNAEKIESKVGIKQRHIVADNETALDLAYEASKFAMKGFDKDQIDFILLCTQSPDFFLPTSACILQDKLQLRQNIGAFDFNLGCSGFIYGLSIAKGLINSKIAKNVLLITSETYSKYIHKLDKANRSIFGDAAAATIITESSEEQIYNFELGTDGSGMCNLIIENGATRNKIDHSINQNLINGEFKNPNNLYMNGPEIFNFTIDMVPKAIKGCLEKNNLSLEEIDYVIFHQANKYMLDYLRKKLKITNDKFYINMINTGNTVSATIPIALKDAEDNGIIKKGQKILLCGFGVGYSWGATIIKY